MKLLTSLKNLPARTKLILGLTGTLLLLILLQFSTTPTPPSQMNNLPKEPGIDSQAKLKVIQQLPLFTDNYLIEYYTTYNTFVITVDSQPYYQHLEEAYQWLSDQGITQENSSIEEGYSRYKPID